ncbi:MAG: ABC-F family ATP-binding cassette domain-containing protein [Clostridia bacterium]|nr:ABC-F family ATP-binding cassette domain-containing protein [Clostridia bacterium]
MILNISNLSKSFGDQLLFEGLNLSVEKGDIVGLIGANGAGKTTLFHLITGAEEPDGGAVIRSPFTTLGYLEQHVCADSERTTYEETLLVFSPLFEMERELAALRDALSGEKAGDPALIARQEELLAAYEAADGLTYKNLTRAVLSGLGFSEQEQELPVRSLSGGQKSKIGLAKLLLQKPDLMLLDEPTNHLDIRSIGWLENFISASHITTIVISHDRYFLDKVCTRIAEISLRKVYVTDGSYSRHMELKAERDLSLQRNYDNTMAEVHRIEGIIEQQRRWNRERNIRTAESKQKQIDRLTKDLEKPEYERLDFSFFFNPDSVSGEEVLDVDHLSMEFPGKVLYQDVSFNIRRGERVFLIGENGIGKTTLLKQILKRVRGVRFGIGVTTGYFDQHQMNLSLNKTVLEEVHDMYPRMTDTEVRSALAIFGFKGDKVFESIETLSGGERAKVALCRLMLRHCNFLLLDEPTNHLDIYSMAALEEALASYEGTLFIISHDRYFINRLADKVIELRPDGATTYDGGFEDYLAALERREEASAGEGKPEKQMGAGGLSYQEQKRLRSERTKKKTALRKAEQRIGELEEEIETVTAEMNEESIAADFEKMTELTERMAALNSELETTMNEWEALAEEVSHFEE